MDFGENTPSTAAIVVAVQAVDDIDADVPSNIESFLAFELTHAAVQSFRLKSVAPKNMPRMSFTLDTSHSETITCRSMHASEPHVEAPGGGTQNTFFCKTYPKYLSLKKPRG